MSAEILNGKELAIALKQHLIGKISALKHTYNIIPSLSVIRVGEDVASQIYVSHKGRQAEELGIVFTEHTLPAHTSREQVLDILYRLNKDSNVHGIIVQLPLPSHLDSHEILRVVDPQKDVDGLHPLNAGLLATGQKGLVPSTPQGCLYLLKKALPNLKGKKAVILGRSNLVGKPLGFLLLKEDCTVTFLHRHSTHIDQECRRADILVAAVGHPRLVQADWIKPDAIVIDVGINRLLKPDGTFNLVGDVDYEKAKEVASFITPVPGGVGAMTVAVLLENTVKCAEKYAQNQNLTKLDK